MSGFLYFFCTHCRARNRWPRTCVGQTLTCPACQKPFVDDDPYWPTNDSDPESKPRSAAVGSTARQTLFSLVGQVIAAALGGKGQTLARGVEREAAAATTEGVPSPVLLAGELQPLYDAPGLRALNPGQRALYCLLVKTFHNYFRARLERFISICLAPFFILAGVLLLLMFMGLFHLLFLASGLCLGGWVNHLLFIIAFVTVLMAVALVPAMEEAPISLSHDAQGGANEIHLGKAGDALSAANSCVLGMSLGGCGGAQVGLLYFAHAEIGLATSIGLWDALLITLDNFIHGVSLGAFESFDIQFAARMEHSIWSASWFFLFRLSFLAVLLIWLIQCLRFSALQTFAKSYPPHLNWHTIPSAQTDVHSLCEWMTTCCQDRESPWLRFPNASLFLALAAAYLQSQFDVARDLGQRWAGATIADSVKVLFIDQQGECILVIDDEDESALDEDEADQTSLPEE